ncbi:MAG: hypothetical protein KDK90_13485 [Leptospiraceae bacterium]|nr:hypothetical protein [Leptospiraceae bacterium]
MSVFLLSTTGPFAVMSDVDGDKKLEVWIAEDDNSPLKIIKPSNMEVKTTNKPKEQTSLQMSMVTEKTILSVFMREK